MQPVTPTNPRPATPVVPPVAPAAVPNVPRLPPPPQRAPPMPVSAVPSVPGPAPPVTPPVLILLQEAPMPNVPQAQPLKPLPPTPQSPLEIEMSPVQMPVTQGYFTSFDTFWGDEKNRAITLMFLKSLLLFLTVILLMMLVLALVVYFEEQESDENNTTIFAITEPTMTSQTKAAMTSKASEVTQHHTKPKVRTAAPDIATTPSTTTTVKPMICTVSETLSLEDPITDGICDYAIFSDLAVVDGDLKPVQGPHAWEVFKSAISHSDRTLGGVSFSSHKATERDGTMRKLANLREKLLELVSDHNVLALGMLGFRHDFSQRYDVFGKTFQYLKAALELREGSMTFLGLWFVTAKNAEAFAKLPGSTRYVDNIIIQTHITMTAQNGSCYAHMISEAKEVGDVPNFATAEVALRSLRMLGASSSRVLFSSTMAVMAYASARGAPNVGPRKRKCDHFFLADIDSVCRETLGNLRSEYWPDDMSESITFRETSGGYMFVFESVNSLNDKAMRFGNITDGWAFFEIQRDIYWPCSTGRPYGRVKHGVSVMRGKQSILKPTT